MKQALIYTRVSGLKQVLEGHGLDSQEKLCRNYCINNGYHVLKVFREEGESGGLFERTAMKQLLAYLTDYRSKHPDAEIVVVFDDLKRFARDVTVHFGLKKEVYGRGATVESPNFKFENTPEGKFVETVMAAQAELERLQNARQVKQKMKARLELGYWCFRSPPTGMKYIKDALYGKILVKVEPYASIFKLAIENYHDGILKNVSAVQQFINQEYNRRGMSDTISLNGAYSVLTELLYTGYMAYEPWGISLRKGHHDGFISLDMYQAVQEKLQGKYKSRKRNGVNLDFTLCQVVLCDHCGKPMTGAWCEGRKEKYAKYWCNNKQCPSKALAEQMKIKKTIDKSKIETEYETLLQASKPITEVIDIAELILARNWKQRQNEYETRKHAENKRLEEIEILINSLAKASAIKLTKGESELVAAYESQIKELTKEKNELMASNGKPRYTDEQFRTATNIVFSTLKEPVRMWKSKEYRDKETIFSMYFDEKLRYDIQSGFRTAILSLPVALMQQNNSDENQLVEMPGIEPGSEETQIQTFSPG